MAISIIAVGTRGDVQPLLALGLGLKNSGIDVQVATHPNFRALVESLDLPYLELSLDIEEVFHSEEGKEWLTSGRNPLKTATQMKKLWNLYLRNLFSDIDRACKDADAILFSYLGMGACHFGEKYNIPCIGTWPTPMTMAPSASMAMAVPGPWARWLNGLVGIAAHYATEMLIALTFGRGQNEWRKRLGLAPIGFPGIVHHLRMRGIPFLYGFSPKVVSRPDQWPSSMRILGYWLLEQQIAWNPSNELKKFMEKEPAPFYIGFGSMVAKDPDKLVAMTVEAVSKARCRAVLSTGWTGLKAEELNAQLPENILAVDYVSHNWLFPQVKGMVHHGGASTVGAVLHSGKPSTIVPFFADQSFWADKLESHGVSTSSIPFKRLTSDKLYQALKELEGNLELRKRSAELAQVITLENGVQEAVKSISELLNWDLQMEGEQPKRSSVHSCSPLSRKDSTF